MGVTLRKIIGTTLLGGGVTLAINAYPALFNRIDEMRDQVRIHQTPSIKLSDFYIGETGLTYGTIAALIGYYLINSPNKKEDE